ncbi:MAG: hypothetical protein R2939_01915 [Kofleriaceae bacterium]
MIDAWLGGGMSRQPGTTSSEITVGISGGCYLDPHQAKTRAVFSSHHDVQTHRAGPIAKTRSSGWSHLRVDYAFAQDWEKRRRVTGIVSWGDGSERVLRADLANKAPASGTPWKAYLGYTQDQRYQPNLLWNTALSWSVGPTFSRFDAGPDGAVTMLGAELHVSLASNPLTQFLSAFWEISQSDCGCGSDPGASSSDGDDDGDY